MRQLCAWQDQRVLTSCAERLAPGWALPADPASGDLQLIAAQGSLQVQNCAEGEPFGLVLQLEQQGDQYALTSIQNELCEDSCVGGVSTGCTSHCPGGRSCDETALLYRATLDLERRRLHWELARHAQVRLPPNAVGVCASPDLESLALDAPCVQREEIEAVFLGYHD